MKLLRPTSVALAVGVLGAAAAMAQTGPNSGRGAGASSPAPSATSPSGSTGAIKSANPPAAFDDSSSKGFGLGGLVNPAAQNGGAISARFAMAAVDGEQRVVVDLYGDRLVSIAASKADEQKFQPGTQAQLSPGQASRIVDTAVNMSGVVQAKSAFVDSNGEVVLEGATGRSNPGEAKILSVKKPAGPPKPDAQLASIATSTNPTVLQTKSKIVDVPPWPGVDSLLNTFSRSGSPRTWGDVLAIGAGFSSNGVLFTGYFYDLFDTVVTLASGQSGGSPAIDYAACYLGSKGAIDDCSTKPGSL